MLLPLFQCAGSDGSAILGNCVIARGRELVRGNPREGVAVVPVGIGEIARYSGELRVIIQDHLDCGRNHGLARAVRYIQFKIPRAIRHTY